MERGRSKFSGSHTAVMKKMTVEQNTGKNFFGLRGGCEACAPVQWEAIVQQQPEQQKRSVP